MNIRRCQPCVDLGAEWFDAISDVPQGRRKRCRSSDPIADHITALRRSPHQDIPSASCGAARRWGRTLSGLIVPHGRAPHPPPTRLAKVSMLWVFSVSPFMVKRFSMTHAISSSLSGPSPCTSSSGTGTCHRPRSSRVLSRTAAARAAWIVVVFSNPIDMPQNTPRAARQQADCPDAQVRHRPRNANDRPNSACCHP
jgi:hypothetical protein